MTRRLLWGVLCAALGCREPASPPAPSVATLQPFRAGATLQRAGAKEAAAADAERRVEEGALIRTPAGVRASLFHDSGAWILLDGGSAVAVRKDGLELQGGRAYVDARGAEPLRVSAGAVTLQAQGASLSVERGAELSVYCAAGQAAWQSGAEGGRLESGLSLLAKGGPPKETAQALWDDWTLGLAEPGPLRPPEPAGVGALSGRRPSDLGSAPMPVIVRRHEVRARIQGALAETEVEQTFFITGGQVMTGVYTVRLPEGAVLREFAVGSEDGPLEAAQLVGRRRPGEPSPSGARAQLEWAGPGRYRGVVSDLIPQKTKVVRLRYSEWLPEHPHRVYRYPMGQSAAGTLGEAPSLGEFTLQVDLSDANAAAVSAGLGAQVEKGRVVLRKSDFRPRADFTLELFDKADPRAEQAPLRAYRSEAVGGERRYLLAQPAPAPGAVTDALDLVLLVDVSAATDEASLDLSRAAAQSLLRQLSAKDRVAVLSASLAARPLLAQAGAPLTPATPERVEALLGALAAERAGGASDLQTALAQAAALVSAQGPGRRGAVVYIGDGRPTVGALTALEIRAALVRRGLLPRLFAVAVGAQADLELLGGLVGQAAPGYSGRGDVIRVEDRPEAARAALHLLGRALAPALTEVTVELGEDVDVLYPEGPVTLTGGEPLQVVARLRSADAKPRRLTLRGRRDGQPFAEERRLEVQDAATQGDLQRRFALARLSRLLARGAGPEAALDVGLRFGVITPLTALVVGAGGGYSQQGGLGAAEDRDVAEVRAFVPPALRGQPPEEGALVLPPGTSTRSERALSIDALLTEAARSRLGPARVCYERRAAGHPELAGRVLWRLKVSPEGAVALVKLESSTLRKPDVEACMQRALSALRLPAPPDQKPHELLLAMQLDQGGGAGPRECSAASRRSLPWRRALWRERLSRAPGQAGATSVWQDAEARCELASWLDRRALLDILRVHVGSTAYQVALYHSFDEHPLRAELQEYLRREILRGVRTREDLRAAQLSLNLEGGVDPLLVSQALQKAKGPAERVAVLRQFLELAPGAIGLRLQLVRELWTSADPGQRREARKLSDALRADPGADAAVRQAVGELLLHSGEREEAARALSEIVEFAPYDAWGRKRLGDLYRAFGYPDLAYREYQVLGWLTPQDEAVLLYLAEAAADAGRLDEALRLTARVAETVSAGPKGALKGPAALARVLYNARLGKLLQEARAAGERNRVGELQSRAQSDGVGVQGGALLALRWSHPDAGLELYVSAPGAAKEPAAKARRRPAKKEPPPGPTGERASLRGGDGLPLEAHPVGAVEPGDWRVTVRCPRALLSGPVEAELLLLRDAAAAQPYAPTKVRCEAPGQTELSLPLADLNKK